MSAALDALRGVDFDWVRTLDSIWTDTPPTGGPNEALVPGIVTDLHRARKPEDRMPGKVLVGPSGVGKTHLVGQIRQEVWQSGGWFVDCVRAISGCWPGASLFAGLRPMA